MALLSNELAQLFHVSDYLKDNNIVHDMVGRIGRATDGNKYYATFRIFNDHPKTITEHVYLSFGYAMLPQKTYFVAFHVAAIGDHLQMMEMTTVNNITDVCEFISNHIFPAVKIHSVADLRYNLKWLWKHLDDLTIHLADEAVTLHPAVYEDEFESRRDMFQVALEPNGTATLVTEHHTIKSSHPRASMVSYPTYTFPKAGAYKHRQAGTKWRQQTLEEIFDLEVM